jgi:hypothetical protein
MVKAHWPRQLIDRMAGAAFTESLARVEFRDAAQAVRDFSDIGREEPPTVGMIYRAAREIEARREEAKRRKQRLLDRPERTPEEIAAAREILRGFMDKVKSV